MLIIINDDASYLSWLNHHRHGFVLATQRKPTKRNMRLHRATCPEIKASKSKRTHWTTARRVKICSCDREELLQWAREETNGEPTSCQRCAPHQQITSTDLVEHSGETNDRHLTKLDREVLGYVVEAAIINLDNETSYNVTVGEVATNLAKSPAQIAAPMTRLIQSGFLTVPGEIVPGKPIPAQRVIHPTKSALRTEPAFAEMTDRQLNVEIENLRRPVDQHGNSNQSRRD